jgi:uncharacterized OsmC-like protein
MLTISLLGRGECEVVHADTGVRVRTSKSPAFGGTGSSFSSTDLLAAALGSCIATDIEPVAERNGLALDAIRVDVEKELSQQPRRIVSMRVHVRLPAAVDDVLLLKLRRAAELCLVQRSLSPDIAFEMVFRRGAESG